MLPWIHCANEPYSNFAVVVFMETQHGKATVQYATGKCI